MNRYNNPRLTNTTVSGTGMKHPMRPHVILGESENGFIRGDLLDANAVIKLIKNAARAAGFPQLASSLDWVDVNDDEAMIGEVGYVTIKSETGPGVSGPDIRFLAIKADNELGCVFITYPPIEGRPTLYYAIKLDAQDDLNKDKNLNQVFPATLDDVINEYCLRQQLLVNGLSNNDTIPSVARDDISEDVLNKVWENKKVIAKNKIATISTIYFEPRPVG